MKVQHHKPGMFKKTALATAVSGALSMGAVNLAIGSEGAIEEIVVKGIRGSLQRAIDIKRDAVGVVDSISAEDVGKFPDLNVAESLQRISGVSIDRNGGEGQAVTVRGLGPQFNTVLVNGRQIATDSGGREFNFDVLAAEQISGADVYKSTRADLQEGGIGATINITTARPFGNPGFQLAGSVKGMSESLSEETSPSASILVSNTFADDTFGALLAVSYQERDVQINQIGTAGWRPGLDVSNAEDGVLFTNVYIPRNWDQVVDAQERTRTNANLVFQFAPSDELSITLDGFVSRFEVDSLVTDLASWFEPDRVGAGATIDPATGTLLTFSQEVGNFETSGNPASDFVSHTRNSRDVSNKGLGISAEWDINEQLNATFDVSTSSAENDRAGRDRFNVVGIINNYTFNGGGGTPTVQHDEFVNGGLPDADLARLHYNEMGNRPTDEDEISEYKADFEYLPDSSVFQKLKFGVYRQEREKSSFQIFGSACPPCGYALSVPAEINFRAYNAPNFFSGLIDTFYTYDGDAYIAWIGSADHIAAVAAANLELMALGEDLLPDSVLAPVTPTLQNNRYTINEDITSLYMDFTFAHELGDMPLTVNFGVRYTETDIEVAAVQSFISDVVPTTDQTMFSNRFGPATDISEGTEYANLIPSVSAKLEIQEDMILRFSVYDSITRPTLSELSPATTFNEPRLQNLTASGGNPALDPFRSENWDVSFEWYYNDTSLASFAVFNKEIDDFITTLTGEETYTLADRTEGPDFLCSVANEPLCGTLDYVSEAEELNGEREVYTVTRPQNGEAARVTGYELAVTHVFDNGFGISANATLVDSNVSLGSDTTTSFALEGLGDSQNLIVFYEADRWQARVAFNKRDEFLRQIDNGFNGEPVNTDTFGQYDISASYDINDNFTLFFEGINITEEELVQTGRFGNQIYSIEDNGSRYAIGVRGQF